MSSPVRADRDAGLNRGAPGQPRRHDIDRLRIFAVATVLVVHAAQVFSPWQTWHVQNAQRSRVLAEGMFIAGLWVMPLFMLLAGRSARYSRARRGSAHYLSERVRRLLPPLVLGTLLVVPPQLWVRRTLDGSFHGSLVRFYPHFFDGLYPAGNLSWGHLWFLAYLLVYAAVTLPLLPRIDAAVAGRALHGLRPGLAHLVLLAAPSIVLQGLLRARWPQTNALVNDWANHALLLPAFLAGYLLSAWPALEEVAVRHRRRLLLVALAASASLAAYAWPGAFDQRLPATWSVTYAAFWTTFGVAAWAWLFAITGLACVHLDVPGRWLPRAREMVYPFYVFHQTVLVLVAWKLILLPAPVFAKFALLVGLGFALTAAISLAVRASGLGRRIFGMHAVPS